MINRRIDPALDRRRLILFFAWLILFYVGVLLITRPVLDGGEAELNKFVIGVMLAPTVGAILACVFGPGLIRFGMPSWWLLAAFLPAALVFLITMIAAPVSGAVTFHPDQVGALLLVAVPQSLLGCIFALGEEIGWRGFLWPLMRRRLTFLASTAIMAGVWWIYHAGLTFAGWYGFIGGIPAFTVGLLGFVLFIGVLTERSRSIWPSVLAHGSWNAWSRPGPGSSASEWLNAFRAAILLVSLVAAICCVLFPASSSRSSPTHALRVAVAGTAPPRRLAHQAAQPSAPAGASRTSSSMSLRKVSVASRTETTVIRPIPTM